MKKKLMSVLLVFVLSTLTIALSACAGSKADGDSSTGSKETVDAAESTDAATEDDDKITVGIAQDIEDSMDPHKAVASGTKEVLFNIYEGLVKPDSEGNLNPAVASDYEITEEGKTYTFTLRDGVKFHDGSLVTVEDVKYSIERCADTSNGGTPLVAAFSSIESVETPDDSTIVIHLTEPNTDFLTYLTVAIIPASNADPDTNPIGTGPYAYVSRSPQEKIVLKKFDEYWGEPAHITNVVYKVCANPDSLSVELNSGSIDMFVRLTTAQAAQLDDQFDVLEGTMNLVQALYLNNDCEYFKDARVRQALCYAVNRQEMLDLASDGKGTIVGSSMYPAFGKYYMEELSDYYEQDIEKAKELLAEAGYPDGFSFTIQVPSNYQPHIDTAQVLAEQLKTIGVNAEIQLIEWESWLSDVYAGRNYEATVVGLDASALTARAMLERFTSTSSKNFTNYSNEAYDEAFAKAVASTDEDEQTADYKECEKILTEDAANVYIQDMASLVALNKKFAGYEFYPLYVQDMAKIYRVED